MSQPQTGPRAAGGGGSIGGLTAALLLRDAGCDVRVYERTPTPLKVPARVSSIVHPATVRYLHERLCRAGEISVLSTYVHYLSSDGSTVHDEECRSREPVATGHQVIPSWVETARGTMKDVVLANVFVTDIHCCTDCDWIRKEFFGPPYRSARRSRSPASSIQTGSSRSR